MSADYQAKVDHIKTQLNDALTTAQVLANTVRADEGDSDLLRKLESYLIPSLNHWINGAQAGNVTDLSVLLTKRK